MKALNFSLSSAVALMCLAMLAGCGSVGVRADRAKVDAINTVAVVGFAVPHKVALPSASQSEIGGSIGFIKGMVKNKGNVIKAANEGNGAQVAPATFAGFTEEMAKDSRMKFMPTAEVTANKNFAALLASYDESEKHSMTKNGVAGLPVIQLKAGAEKLEFAQKAAEALGVDGVILVDFYSMGYAMHAGKSGGLYSAGAVKVEAHALYNMFDKNGQSVWASSAFARPDVIAGLAGDEVKGDPTELHKSAGTEIAAVVKKDYQEWAKKAK